MEEQLVADFFTDEKKHWWHTAKRSLLKQFLIRKNSNILVAGIGGGLLCEELKTSGHRVVGIDISSISCAYVKKTFGITTFNEDLEKPLKFENGSFDYIIIADVLEHLDNEKQLLSEAYRCVKPDGALIITVPAYQHMWSRWDIRLNHKRRYSINALKKELTEAGFRVKKISYYHMLLYPFVYIYRKILRLPKGESRNKSDFSVFSHRRASGLLGFYYFFERSLLNVTNLPFGLSIFAVGIKRG